MVFIRIHHVQENFDAYIGSNTFVLCQYCRHDESCPVNMNGIRAVLILAYYGAELIKIKEKYPTIMQSKLLIT